MKLPFFSPTSTEHEVQGTVMQFYPARVYLVGKLRGFLKPLFQSLATLGASSDTDISREHTESKGADGEYQMRTALSAMDPALVQMRATQKENAINNIVDNLTADASLKAIATLIIDSLRDDYPERPTDAELKEFVENVPLPAMVSLLTGVVKANREVFGPLTARVSAAVATLKRRLEVVEDGGAPPPQPSVVPDPGEAPKTDSGPTLSKP